MLWKPLVKDKMIQIDQQIEEILKAIEAIELSNDSIQRNEEYNSSV
jgi:transcription initiation factor IIF auxiliary subunit